MAFFISEREKMNALMKSGDAKTMSSREIAELTGSTHDNVLKTIRRLYSEGLVSTNETPYSHPQNGQSYNEFNLSFRDTLLVVSGYSAQLRARIIDRWQELEEKQPPSKQLSAAEMLLQNVQILVSMERRQSDQEQALTALTNRVDEQAGAQLLTVRPQNSETITMIRLRMNKEYGLSAPVVDAVMRQHPWSPKPAGMVRNEREEAAGSSYAVYWRKDVSAAFKKFVSECQRTSVTQAAHPLIESRFKLNGGAS